MAIFKSTAFSKLRNSFGNLTTCRSKGQNIVKEKVTTVFNPRTLAQQMQRLRTKTLVDLCAVYEPVISIGFPQRERKYSPDNMFVKLNQKAVAVSEQMEVAVDYAQVLVAKGNRRLAEMTVASDAEAHQLTFTRETEEFARHAVKDDLFYTAVLEQDRKKVKVFPLNERKDTEPVVVTLPDAWDMNQLIIYVFVLSADKQHASLSECLIPA